MSSQLAGETGRRPAWQSWAGRSALLVLALAVLGRVGLWQWDKARGHGSWQNYGYAIQWWLFAGFAVFLFAKVVLDHLAPGQRPVPPEPEAVPDPRPVAAAPEEDDDDELAAYNRHLAWLNQQAR